MGITLKGVESVFGSNRMKIIGIVAVVIVIIVVVAVVTGGSESPADVAIAFYRAGNGGNYPEAYNYLTPETRMAWEMMGAFMSRFDNSMDAATKNGTITRIDVTDAIQYGGVSANVRLTLHYRDGSQRQDVLTLTKVDRRWRIFSSTLLLTP